MNGSTPPIRSEQRAIVTVAALIFGPLLTAGPVVVGVWLAMATKFSPLSWLVLAAASAGSAFIAYHMIQSYQWVELDGDVIRGRRFWTRQEVERSVYDIDQILPLVHRARTVETAIADKIADRLIGPNRGYEIRFKDGGRRIALVCGDMTNVEELAAALAARLATDDTA